VAIDDGEHFLVKLIEKFIHHVGEIQFASQEVSLKLDKQIAEHIRVLLVNHSVSLLEHLMEAVSRLRKECLEEFWNMEEEEAKLAKFIKVAIAYESIALDCTLLEVIELSRISISNCSRYDNMIERARAFEQDCESADGKMKSFNSHLAHINNATPEASSIRRNDSVNGRFLFKRVLNITRQFIKSALNN
jgi:hypothetical protein